MEWGWFQVEGDFPFLNASCSLECVWDDGLIGGKNVSRTVESHESLEVWMYNIAADLAIRPVSPLASSLPLSDLNPAQLFTSTPSHSLRLVPPHPKITRSCDH